jgi:2-keto-4-pentenoate hydratase/2-oxohepta-3-ene-1,7-dioic acid hydratase in catechol pathway
MKLMSYDIAESYVTHFGVVFGDTIYDHTEDFLSLDQFLALGQFDELVRIADLALQTFSLAEVEPSLPIIPGPRVFCVGQNYVEHIREMGYDIPEYPSIFMRTQESFAPHRAGIVKPSVSDHFDYEGELTVVIGLGGRHIAEADALDHVAGYTIMNDGSVRDWQRRVAQVAPGKNFDCSGALGPWIVTADEIPDPAALTLETRVDGEVRQHTSTGDMVFSVPVLISYISTFCHLMPGDIISTGSPSGSGAGFDPPRWLKPGEIVEIEISGIGTLRNQVVAE